MTGIAIGICWSALAHASQMERCSYKTEHDGKVTETVESPGAADGSNSKRFAKIVLKEQNGEEGWKGYRTFDIRCDPLDSESAVWNMFVQTENGQVSLVHSLTEDACYYTLARLNPSFEGWHSVQGSDFKRGECFK